MGGSLELRENELSEGFWNSGGNRETSRAGEKARGRMRITCNPKRLQSLRTGCRRMNGNLKQM